MSVFISAITTLAAVALGAWLSRGDTRKSWRRDRRTDAYATMIQATRDLEDRMFRTAEQHAVHPHPNDDHNALTVEDVLDITKPMRSAAATVELLGGPKTQTALDAIYDATYIWIDVPMANLNLDPLHEANNHLVAAMRSELDPPRRRSLRSR
ncbi:MAG: hypothetical protein JWL79_3085 [Frankiales bacterium]|nr:hypothetical protein [Frankiales bacterium]